MIKIILNILFIISLLTFGGNNVANATSMLELIDNEQQNITVNVSNNALHISGAFGQVLYIYNVAGVCVMNVRVDSNEKLYNLSLSKGCYIVKVGKIVRKIAIK